MFESPNRAKVSKASAKERLLQMDPLGTVLLIASVVCLLLALTWGGFEYPWSAGRVIASLVLSGVLGLAFVAVQLWSDDNATIPRRLLTQRSIAGASWFSVCTGGAFFVLVYWIPIWFQAIQGTTAVQSGIRNLAMVLATVVSSILGGAGITALGFCTPFLLLSSLLLAVGAGLLTTLRVDSGAAQWIGYQVLCGLGVGLSMLTPIVAVQAVLPPSDIPAGTALVMFLQTIGGAVFVAVAQSIFGNELVEAVTAAAGKTFVAAVQGGGATVLRNPQIVPPALLPDILVLYNTALTHTWYISVALACLSIVGALAVEWKSIKTLPALPLT